MNTYRITATWADGSELSRDFAALTQGDAWKSFAEVYYHGSPYTLARVELIRADEQTSKPQECDAPDVQSLQDRLRMVEEKLAVAELKNADLKKTLKRANPAGTHMAQEDYLELEKSATELIGHCDIRTILTDAEAKVLINSEFGFEASRIEILHEAGLDVTEEGSRYVQIKKVPRKPVYSASDWNYIRFDVHAGAAVWYYEMINASLHQVSF